MKRDFLRAVLLGGFLFISAICVNAQSVNGNLGTVTRGSAAKATVYLTLPGGLHANSNAPHTEYAIPTVVRASAAKGVKIGPVIYPRGHNKKFAFSEQPINVYEGRVPFTFTVTVPATFKGSTVKVTASVKYQACTEEVCYPPKTKAVTLTAAVR